MNDKLKDKLKSLPSSPGVYFHKSKSGEIIYVGKAAVLKNRVRQYFQSSRDFDNKTLALVREIVDTDWIETESEIDALFLESEMVKRYMPRYNVLLRDDKSQTYVRIDMQNDWPTVGFTRGPLDDGASYYGPFFNSYALKKALRYLRRVFPYYIKTPNPNNRDLDTHIGLSPDPESTSNEYKKSLRKLVQYIEGGRVKIAKEIEKEMLAAAKEQNFEHATRLRNRLYNIRELQRRIMFGEKEFLDISKDRALADLRDLLSLDSSLKRLECYDVSHMSGRDVVASMVVFTNGVSDRAEYRKFKTRQEKNDDFFNMQETITRRLSERNIKSWGTPELMVIDGGKGQLDAAIKARNSKGLTMPIIGLAKKQEQIVVHFQQSNVVVNNDVLLKLDGYKTASKEFVLINLPHSTHVIKLLQRIRDESHRFAVSYHTILKRGRQKQSLLDEIPGIGPITKKKLLRQFGSVSAIHKAEPTDIIKAIGESKARLIIAATAAQKGE